MPVRSQALATRLLQGAEALVEFAAELDDRQWQTPVVGDGRSVGVVVHPSQRYIR